MDLAKQLDKNLLNLAWSLWTELGVAGVKQKHQNTLILIEELILFTSALTEIDPRLRDESIDWCSNFHRFISISRMKSLMGDFEGLVGEAFSQYASTINMISPKANWPVFVNALPLKINLSHKSILRPHVSSALLNIRARSIFGAGARADLLTFFVVHPLKDFSVAEVAEIGYSKRSLAEVLQDFHFGNLFEKFMVGNQQRYRLNKNSSLFDMLAPIPKYAPSWHLIFKILLTLRACILRTKNYSESSKVIEIRNCLKEHEQSLLKLGIPLPSLSSNFQIYLENFSKWILDWTDRLANGSE